MGEMPKFRANDEAPKTNLSALQTKAIRAISNIKICSSINDSKVKLKLSLVVEQKRSKLCYLEVNNIFYALLLSIYDQFLTNQQQNLTLIAALFVYF